METSKIVLVGGITASDVLYNFVRRGGGVAMSGGASVAGVLLAPQRGVSLSNAIVTGEIISGGSGIFFQGRKSITRGLDFENAGGILLATVTIGLSFVHGPRTQKKGLNT